MITFNEYIENKKPKILLENDLLDNIIKSLGSYDKVPNAITLNALSTDIYHYLTLHPDNHNTVDKLFKNDPAKYKQVDAQHKEFLKKVTAVVESNGYTSNDNNVWLEFTRIRDKNNPKAKKEDGTKTTKRYISIDLNDLYKAYSRLPTLAKELNKVVLRPEFDKLSFKVPMLYHTAMGHKDNIVIHFYDKMAKDQVEQAVQNFLNAAGLKESDRSKFSRVNFGKDDEGTSDSDLIANRLSKYFVLYKKEIPNMLKMPNIKDELKKLIDNVSMNSAHRS